MVKVLLVALKSDLMPVGLAYIAGVVVSVFLLWIGSFTMHRRSKATYGHTQPLNWDKSSKENAGKKRWLGEQV